MCGRFVIASSPQLLVDRFGVEDEQVGERDPDYNVTPRGVVPVVRERPPRGGDPPGPARRVLSPLRWGLVPSWADGPAIGDRMINARAETVRAAKAYGRAFAKRRCIVPADAFYEWLRIEPGPDASTTGEQPTLEGFGPERSTATPPRTIRQPWLVRRRDGEPLAFAGVWEVWRDPAVDDRDDPGAWLRTFAIVTTRANALLARVHDRMPVVLDESRWDAWLDPAFDDLDALERFLEPAPEEWFDTYEVSARVNSPANNDADLLRPVHA
jgi:putative SOS response-associated peptidase YedK